MYTNLKKITAIFTCSLTAVTLAQAAVVVDLEFVGGVGGSHEAEYGPTWSGTAGDTATWAFDAANPLFNGVAARNQVIHGGFSAGNYASTAGVKVSDEGGIDFVQLEYVTAGGASRAQGILLWDSSDFLDTSSTWGFDNTSDSSITLGINDYRFNDPEGLRVVIRNGSDYYLSSTVFQNGVGVGNPVFSGADGATWATFNPSNFASYDNRDANLGFGSISFSSPTFNNVTGVGFIFDIERGNGNPTFKLVDFQAELVAVPEPATYALFAGFACAALIMIKRRRESLR